MMYEKHIKKQNEIISFSIVVVILSVFLIFYYLDVIFELTDYFWSLIFVTIISIMYILRFINKENIVSLYSLFFLTSLMFLGGRFLSIFLGYNSQPLFELDFFVYTLLDDHRKSKLFFILISGFLSLELGYYLSRIIVIKSSKNLNYSKAILNSNKYVLFGIMIVIFALLSFSSYKTVITVINGDYLALYVGQAKKYGFDYFSLLKTILLASSGIYLTQKSRSNRVLFLFLMGAYFFLELIAGARGGFITYLLFLVWYLNNLGLKKASFFKFFLIIISVLIFLTFIFGLISFRISETAQISPYQKMLSLIYEQGITLMVFNESLYIEEYPIIPFFQNFIPGFSFFYSKLIGNIFPYDNSFSAYISYTLNPEVYNLGYGVGWSFFSDAYLYGLKTPLLFCFWITNFSIFLNYLQVNINRNIYVKIITISLVSPILFLPRSGLNTVFPLIPYILVLFFFVNLLSGSSKK